MARLCGSWVLAPKAEPTVRDSPPSGSELGSDHVSPIAPKRRSGAGKLVVGMLALLVLAAGSFALGQHLQSPQQAIAEALPPARTVLAVPVEEVHLIDTVAFRADVELGDSRDVSISASEEIPIVTEVLVEKGQVVEEGAALVAINGRRRIVLQGILPAYRDLMPGVHGPDVAQLQEALVRLGYEVGRAGYFDWATQRAVRSMFNDRGVSLSIDQALGGVVVEHEWLVLVPELPSQVATMSLSLGDNLREVGTPHLKFSDSDLFATAMVDMTVAAEMSQGQPVEVSSGSTSLWAEVAEVTATSEGDRATVILQFVSPPPAAWQGLNVKATAVFERTSHPVLAVPVSAVYGDTSGQAYVRRVTSDGRTQRVNISVGAIAAGYVEITTTAALLSVGDQVEVGAAS